MEEIKKIAVFTSGGDSPGMNPCIRSVVRCGIHLEMEVYGIKYGYNGMINGDIDPMISYSVSNILQLGGTILKSARSEEFRTKKGREKAFKTLGKFGIQGLVAIGGDGTLTGAKMFNEEFGVPVIGIPGTIDNDLFGSDYTLGFNTAVNTALYAIDRIRDTATSHGRIFFVEVMGRNAGHIVLFSGIGGGAEIVLIPENASSIEGVTRIISECKAKQKTSILVVVAEGGELGGAHEIAKKVKESLPDLSIRVTTLGHVQRGGSPFVTDRILGSRLGYAAVKALRDGETCMMVGIVNDKVERTPIEDAIGKQKGINKELLELIPILG